jgi:colicin import membrane protein
MAVTREQIFEAADQIAATGQRATLEAVRQRVGGSYTTISPVLNAWKSRQKGTPLREAAPQAVGERLAEVGADIWAMALELANTRLAAEREALEKARADMEAGQSEATELADKLTAEVDSLQAQCAELGVRAAASEKEAGELRGQLTVVQEQAHTAQARAVEIEHRAADLRAELDRAHQNADQVRADMAKQQKDTETERDEARRLASTAREEAARLAGQLTAYQEQTAALLASLASPESHQATSAPKRGSVSPSQ